MYTSYKDMIEKLENYQSFIGNSVRGERFGNLYRVYSYDTEILSITLDSEEVEYFNTHKYSSTTSRLQNILRRVYNINNK